MPVPGMSGVHEIGTSGVRLGDLTVWPHYELTGIPGFKSLGELEDARDLPVGRGREIPRTALRRGKPFTYAGVIRARSQPELDRGIDALVVACIPTEEQRIAVTSKLPALPADPTQPVSGMNPAITVPATWFMARITALDPPEQHPDPGTLRSDTHGYERSFALGVRMSDARFFAETSSVVTTTGISSLGGTALPWTLPVALDAPGVASGAAAITVGGNAPADPIVDLAGPSTNPGIRSDTLGREVRLHLSLAAGQFLRIDFRDRSVLLNGTEDIGSLLDRDLTDWWDGDTPGLVPNSVNSLRYVADSLTDPAVATITYNNSYWS
jgi:hypothetical protein